jgi:uncharacterized protein YcbK (DUF882 family)
MHPAWTQYLEITRKDFHLPDRLDPVLLAELDQLFYRLGRPFRITSDWRNDPSSSHHTGKAVDIAVNSGYERYRIVELALRVGFTRIGVYDRHIHLDVCEDRPAPVIWQGTSK